jgi:hypothetical protein
VPTNREKGIKIKKSKGNVLPVFKRVLQIPKQLMYRRSGLQKFISKGEVKIS